MSQRDTRRGARPTSLTGTSLYAAGLVALFVGERVIEAGRARGVVSVLGMLLVLAAMTLRVLRVQRGHGEARPIERTELGLMGLGATALLLYFLQSDASAFLRGGKALAAGWPRLAVALQALWPALLLLAVVPLFLVELAYASMKHAARLEVGRVRDAALSGVGLAFAVVFAFAAAYVTSERDVKVDLSYFRTTRPGEATRKIVRALDQPLTVAYFFPPGSEVREEVKEYFDELANESGKLEVKGFDQAVDVAKARELGASGNGVVVLARGARREQLSVGVELEQARGQLRQLDKEVQKRLLAIARPGRNVYLTVGHGERMTGPRSDTDKRFTIRALRQLLLDQSYAVRDLGAAEGLASDVPADAGVVMIIGPEKPFLPEEVAALGRYLDRGGRLFIALDPEASLDGRELLEPLGLTFSPVMLANDQIYARRTYQPSDRANVVTNSFSSHPSVATLGKLHAPLILPGAGALEERKVKPKGVTIDFTARALAGTWSDQNGNFEFDKDAETKKGFQLAAVVTKHKEGGKGPTEDGRALVLGDSDCITDPVLGSLGNAYFLVDGMKWLLGDEALAGETQSEVDQPIAHTRGQDAAWFYSTVFLAPAVVLGVGFADTRRRKRARGLPGRSTSAGTGGAKGPDSRPPALTEAATEASTKMTAAGGGAGPQGGA